MLKQYNYGDLPIEQKKKLQEELGISYALHPKGFDLYPDLKTLNHDVTVLEGYDEEGYKTHGKHTYDKNITES